MFVFFLTRIMQAHFLVLSKLSYFLSIFVLSYQKKPDPRQDWKCQRSKIGRWGRIAFVSSANANANFTAIMNCIVASGILIRQFSFFHIFFFLQIFVVLWRRNWFYKKTNSLLILYLSRNSFTVSPNLVTHASPKHFDTDIEFAFWTIHYFHFSFLAWVTKSNKAFQSIGFCRREVGHKL